MMKQLKQFTVWLKLTHLQAGPEYLQSQLQNQEIC